MLQASEQLHAAMGSLFPTQWLIFRRERGVFNLSNIQCVILLSHERQINMDYSLCKVLSYNMVDIPVALVMYDIMCQYGKHLQERVARSPGLSIPSSLDLRTGIGLFHIHGHQDSCLPRFSPSYIPGAKQVDGEIIETLWAPLNDISRSLHGMTLFHRQEVLDAHMQARPGLQNTSADCRQITYRPALTLRRWQWRGPKEEQVGEPRHQASDRLTRVPHTAKLGFDQGCQPDSQEVPHWQVLD